MNKITHNKRKLKPYMAYAGEFSTDGAMLIFALTAKEAKLMAWGVISGWGGDCVYIDVKTSRLWKNDHLFDEADAEKLRKGIAHIVESPKLCKDCELWGSKLNDGGVCSDCANCIGFLG